MVYQKDESHWNPFDTKLEAYIKRRALDRPRYLPAHHEPGGENYLDANALFRFLPKEGDYPLKKQKLDGWKSAFEDESTLDGSSEVDDKPISYDDYIDTASDIPNSLDSRRSNSLGSCSDHVFSSPSSQSASSSRSSSRTRHSEIPKIRDAAPSELDSRPTSPEQNIPHFAKPDLGQTLQSELPPQKFLLNQSLITVASVACRIPLTSIDGNRSGNSNFGAIKSQSSENMDRSSHTTSVSTAASLPDVPSVPEADGQSTEGDESSQSRPSSHVSDTGATVDSAKPIHDNELEALIKDDVLRADPLVADIFYRNVEGKLEYSPPEYPDQVEGVNEFSLLALLELEAFGLVQHSGANTECPPSSTGPAPTSRVTQHKTSASSTEQNKNNGPGGLYPTKNASTSQDDPNQLVKAAVKANSSQNPKAQPLRCIHNAIAPGTFSVNPETLEKFRSCSGPGWNSVQHLKEHMKNVHTKEVKLQCNRCQGRFPDADDLKSHELNVDCTIRCPDCPDEFFTKAQRQEHQRESHLEEAIDPALRELDDSMWKQINDNLQTYTSSVKNKRGGASGDPDPDRERWVLSNIARFENGRSKTKVNSKLELGQWYTMFRTLAPNMKILEHPFYDYGTPRSDYAQERILFIHDTMIDARVQAHGMPPSNFDLQREWYKEALRDSLRVAARSKKVSHIKRKASPAPSNTLGPSPGPGSGPSTVNELGYSGSVVTTPQMPQTPAMNSNAPSMSILPHNYHLGPQQHTLQAQIPQWGMNANTSNAITLNPAAMNYQFFESQNTMTSNSGHTFPAPYNFIGQSNQNEFNDLAGNDPYTGWQGDEGGNGDAM